MHEIKAQCAGFGVTTTSTAISCFGGMDGSITAIPVNGTAPFTYSWSTNPIQTTATLTGLPSGSYTITLSDVNGCSSNAQGVVTAPPAFLHTSSFSAVTCNGGTNGSATVNISGGTQPYSYSWNTLPAQTTTTATGLSAGSWQVSVTDNLGCPYNAIVSVSQPPSLAVSFTQTPVSCLGNADGSLLAQATGGTPAYSYSWNTLPIQVTQQATALTQGTWTVTVTDQAGCTFSNSAIVFVNAPVLINILPNAVNCNGQNNGSAISQVSGGTPPYAYSWNTLPVQNTQQATSLSAGTWQVSVTDARGCAAIQTVLISEPPALSVTTTAADVTCFGQSNGAAICAGSGGVTPYQFQWNTSPVSTTATITGLPVGLYTITLIDNNGCQTINQAVIREPQPLSVQTTYTMTPCFGGSTGSVSAQVSGGISPYTYLWNTGQTTSTLINLSTGNYSVQILDANNCATTGSVFLPQPAQLQVQVNGTNLTCINPPQNGTAWASAVGGTLPYAYAWTGGATPTQAYNTGFAAGTWGVQVTDGNGCSAQGNIVLNAPPLPQAITGSDTFFCEGSGGVPINGQASGGVPPYTYSWSPNNGSLSNAFVPNPFANPDSITVYQLQVIDAAGCRSIPAPLTVTVYDLPVVDAGPDEPYCAQGPAVFISGQILNPIPGGYSIQWTPSSGLYCDTCLLTYANPGVTTIYTLRVTHNLSGCRSDSTTLGTQSTLIVNVKPRPIAYAGPDTSVCQGAPGTICGTATGAGPLYTWAWSPSQFLSDSSLQCPGVQPQHTMVYFLVVTSDGCESVADSVMVSVIPSPVVDAGNVKNVCLGDSIQLDGQTQQMGTQSYHWTPGISLNDSTILQPIAAPGLTTTYYIQATLSGCAGQIDSVTVLVHPRPIVNAGLDTVLCDSTIGYVLQGNYTGGGTPAWISWSPSYQLSAVNVLHPVATPGKSTVYKMTVTSGTFPTQCSSSDSVLITVLPPLNLQVTQDTNVICFGDSIQLNASGGNGSATFSWTPSSGLSDPLGATPMAAPVNTTSYVVQISEGQCFDRDTLRLQVHPQLNAAFTLTQPSGCAPHQVDFLNRSLGGLIYNWNYGDGTPESNNLQDPHIYNNPGTYPVRLILIGIGGCRDTAYSPVPVSIQPEFVPQVEMNPTAPIELFLPGGKVNVKEVNPRSREWVWNFGDGNQSLQSVENYTYKQAGEYQIQLTIKDSAGCQANWMSGPIIIKTPDLFWPNVFTPNGDGIGDFFLTDYQGNETFWIQIFDRWGVVVFESRNVHQGWNGQDLNGQVCADGVYLFTLQVGQRNFSGSISLVR